MSVDVARTYSYETYGDNVDYEQSGACSQERCKGVITALAMTMAAKFFLNNGSLFTYLEEDSCNWANFRWFSRSLGFTTYI